jgi:hypothetical protein
MIDLQTKLAGEYRLVINRADGNVEDTGWFDNLILNQGLDYLGNSLGLGIVRYAQVGTGTSTPVATQTALDARVAGTESSPAGAQAVTATNEGAPLYRTLLTYAYPFAQGSVVGNITEVGVGISAAAGNNLFSRARIVDNLGAPTSITIVALDQLTVYYRVRIIPPLTDATGTVSISSTNYNYTMRVSNVASFANVQFLLNSSNNFSQAQNAGHLAYPAGSVLGAITGFPSGSPGVDGTATTSSYTNGTYYRDVTFNWSISQGNAAGGIQCIKFVWPQSYSVLQFQVRFDTVIPKTNTNVLALNVRYSWARA